MQFMDDVADVTAGVAEAGKSSFMDADKRTAMDLLGVEGARAVSIFKKKPSANWKASARKPIGCAALRAK